ncbi:hypothetical protein Pint_33407 [Pistacia integerrima]|uniref:Uncharacterized protein n=1 Tax=Pistacia integerrima TaxID=434235 RepID=A0ACC0X8P9_9ROSI|nr:hypothetical protein Pint_33407 [Pistacia integerrima]
MFVSKEMRIFVYYFFGRVIDSVCLFCRLIGINREFVDFVDFVFRLQGKKLTCSYNGQCVPYQVVFIKSSVRSLIWYVYGCNRSA